MTLTNIELESEPQSQSEPEPDPQAMLQKYTTALSSFSASSSTFRILSSLTQHAPGPLPPPSTLYVLDSSFNPPTIAHLRIATSALLSDPSLPPKRLLLLLATQNADKAPKPAPFPHRLAMMHLFAQDLLSSLALSPAQMRSSQSSEDSSQAAEQPQQHIGVDIAVTTLPYFVDKAAAIASSAAYPQGTTQVHLTGFDTLIRILDPKYYPPSRTLAPLDPFLSAHRLRVAYRTDADWGERGEQDDYLRRLGDGERESEGGKREWAGRIELVEAREEGAEVISSTRVREVARKGDREGLDSLVTKGVGGWVVDEGLYLQD